MQDLTLGLLNWAKAALETVALVAQPPKIVFLRLTLKTVSDPATVFLGMDENEGDKFALSSTFCTEKV